MISGFWTCLWLPKPVMFSFGGPGYSGKYFFANRKMLGINSFEHGKGGDRKIPPIRVINSTKNQDGLDIFQKTWNGKLFVWEK